MNCTECRENLTAHLEGLLDPAQDRDVTGHLDSCSACRTEVALQTRLRERLVKNGKAFAQAAMEAVVMDRIRSRRASELRRTAMHRRIGKMGLGLAAAAAIAAALFVPWDGGGAGRVQAAEVMAQAVEALSGLRSVYLSLNVRGLPRDNFEMIGLDFDFVSHELWKEFGDKPKWRVEKSGRVVVMDGEASTLLIRDPAPGGAGGMAARGGVDTGFVTWMKYLLDVDRVLESEMESVELNGWSLELIHDEGSDGTLKLVVVIEALAQGDFTNDWLKNKSISASDHRRVYRFDAETMRLEDLQIWVHGDDRDVLVLDIGKIVYNPELDPGLFVLDLPDDVIWFQQAEVLPDNDAYARLSPAEAARAFFEACAEEDWDEALRFWSASQVDRRMELHLGGLEIIHIGEPFKSGRYPGWFVPYKIKLRSGDIKKHKLAVRNDNPGGRYVVDGGI